MNVGENEQAMRKIRDMVRLVAVVLLLLHFYYANYHLLGWRSDLTDRLLANIYQTVISSLTISPGSSTITFCNTAIRTRQGRNVFYRLLPPAAPLQPARPGGNTGHHRRGREQPDDPAGLNREWIKRSGDFFVESPINLLTAIIWYLRRLRRASFVRYRI